MRVVVSTNDQVRLSFLIALLRDAGIFCVLLDGHISALEGSIGAFPRRLAVADEDERQARRILGEAGGELMAETLLGGRVRHAQLAHGHRTGIEPVLLAASIPARPGERVLEGGTGSGAGLLCLAARVGDISGLGIERDPVLAARAATNFAANGFASLRMQAADLADARPEGVFDHAFANPPWHDPSGTPSANARQEAARRGAPGLFVLWAGRLAAPLRHRGTLTLAIAAAMLPAGLAALAAAGCGSPAVLPLWPRAGRPARLLLLRGVKGGRGPCVVLPGLTLHGQAGGYTTAAEAILRDAAPLPFGAT